MKFPLEHLARIFHFSPTSCVEAKGFISDLTSSAMVASTSEIWFSIQNEPSQEQQTLRERNGRGSSGKVSKHSQHSSSVYPEERYRVSARTRSLRLSAQPEYSIL